MSFGPLLQRWRQSKRMTQEQLAGDAEVSTRHLSCLERGKARPSREMVLVLASVLELELRDRNVLLGTAGFAPVYSNSTLESLTMEPIRKAIGLVLQQQEPYGAVVVDRLWNVVQMNAGATRLMAAFWPAPPEDPKIAANLMRASLHPAGLRPSIVNWVELATLLMQRMDRDCAMHPHDEERAALRTELRTYPGVAALGQLQAAGDRELLPRGRGIRAVDPRARLGRPGRTSWPGTGCGQCGSSGGGWMPSSWWIRPASGLRGLSSR